MVIDTEKFRESITSKGYYGDRGTYNKGFHGLGDPGDKTLNELEINVAIPCWERDIILRDYCSNENQEYTTCHDNTYFFNRFYACSEQKSNLNKCVEYWKNRVDLKEQATAEYLEDRTLYRSTGLTKSQREDKVSVTEKKAGVIVQKIRSLVLNDEEMKKYEEKVKATKSKEN